MSSIKEAVQSLNEFVEDLTSLHVQTFTGEITFTSNQGANSKYEDIESQIQQAKTAGEIKLVAESLYKFDGDSYNFLTSDEGIPSSALELHKAAVEGGIKTRQGLIEMAKDAIGL